ncbi:MAG TPA: hypothetical protein VF572_03670 [Candidatus Saccharimonadales bacterium]|jgi:chromosome segregation ATPase
MTDTPVTLNSLNTKIDHLTDLMIAGFDNMNGRFDRLEERMDRMEARMDHMEARMDALEVAQRETNTRLSGIEGRLDHLESLAKTAANDIKELYGMISEFKRDFPEKLRHDTAVQQRVKNLEDFTTVAAQKLGII